jgi:two-component system, NarL family, nitrate/nitrite response regulator NarL
MPSPLAGTTVPFAATRAISIVIADDHGLFRAGLRGLLESEPDLRVIGEATSGSEAVVVVDALKPDILLLDLSISGRSGLDVLRALARPAIHAAAMPGPAAPAAAMPMPRTIVLAAAIDDDLALEALRLGARGILLKDSPPPLLFKCVRAVASGECWLGNGHVANLVRHLQLQTARPPVHDQPRRAAFGLTPRERQVVSAIADGSTNRDIAQRYSVSADTVKHHLTNIYDKCGVSTRLELALFAVHHGLVDAPEPSTGPSTGPSTERQAHTLYTPTSMTTR